jgi:hypothetical protein
MAPFRFVSDPWLAAAPRRDRAAVALAAEVADANEVLHNGELFGDTDPSPQDHAIYEVLRRALARTAAMADIGVPVKVAADLLEVTPPTVNAWIRHGILEQVPEHRPKQVTAVSLGEAAAAVRFISRHGSSRRRMTELVQFLQDRRTIAELTELLGPEPEFVRVDPERISELFS